MMNENLASMQLGIQQPHMTSSQTKANQKQEQFSHRMSNQADVNQDYYTASREDFNEKTKHIRLPLGLTGASTKILLSQRNSALKALQSQQNEISGFKKMMASDTAGSIFDSSAFGSMYGFSKGLGRKQRIQEERAMAPQLGAAGKAGRISNIYSSAGTLAALPMMASMASGFGSMGMKGLTSTLTGGAMAPMLGIMAAQMGASMWKGKAKQKIQPKRPSQSQIEKEHSVSQQFQGQINRLASMGQIQPADQIKLQYLGIIADRVGPITAIYSELDLIRQEKEKGVDSFDSNYDKQLYGEDSSMGLVDKTLDYLEGGLTQALSKFNPFQQITDFVFSGKSPKTVQEELAEQYGYKDEKEMSKTESQLMGLNIEQYRLMTLTSKQLLTSAPTFESKTIALQSGMFDIMRLQASELVAIRKVGMGVSDSSMYGGANQEMSVWEQIKDYADKKLNPANIPGVNAIWNMLKLPFTIPTAIFDKLTTGYEKVEKSFLGSISEYDENQDEIMKELGLYKSTQDQATEFAARGLPDSLSEITFLSERKLEVLQEISEVSQLQYQAISGLKYTGKDTVAQKQVWDEIRGEFVTTEQYTKNREKERTLLSTRIEQDFRKSFLGISMFAKDWAFDKNRKERKDLENQKLLAEEQGTDTTDIIRRLKEIELRTDSERIESITSKVSGIRKSLGFDAKTLSVDKNSRIAQMRRNAPDSRETMDTFSEEQYKQERSLSDWMYDKKRTLKSGTTGVGILAGGLGAFKAAGLASAAAASSGAGMISAAALSAASLPLLGVGVGLGLSGIALFKFLKRRSLEEKSIRESQKNAVIDDYRETLTEDQINEIKDKDLTDKEISLLINKINKEKSKQQQTKFEPSTENLENNRIQSHQLTSFKKILLTSKEIKRTLKTTKNILFDFKIGTFDRLDKLIDNKKESTNITDLQINSRQIEEDELDSDYNNNYGPIPIRVNMTTGPNREDNYYVEAQAIAAAEGGIVTKPVNVIAGEKGKEAILPLEKNNIDRFFSDPISKAVRGSFSNMFGKSKSGSRNIAQELEEVKQDQEIKEEKTWRTMVLESLTGIDENTGKKINPDGKGGLLNKAGSFISDLFKNNKVITALAGGFALFAAYKTVKNNTEKLIHSTLDLFKIPQVMKSLSSIAANFSDKASGIVKTGANVVSKGFTTGARWAGNTGKFLAKLPFKAGKAAVNALTLGSSNFIGRNVMSLGSKIPGVSGVMGKAGGLLGKAGGILGKAAAPITALQGAWDLGKDISDSSRIDKRAEDFKKAGILGKGLTMLNPYQAGSLIGNTINKGYGNVASKLTGGKYKGKGWLGDMVFDATHDSMTEQLVDKLADKGVIDKNFIGKSHISDWSVIKKLSIYELNLLTKFKDFGQDTIKDLKSLIKYKQSLLKKKKPKKIQIKKDDVTPQLTPGKPPVKQSIDNNEDLNNLFSDRLLVKLIEKYKTTKEDYHHNRLSELYPEKTPLKWVKTFDEYKTNQKKIEENKTNIIENVKAVPHVDHKPKLNLTKSLKPDNIVDVKTKLNQQKDKIENYSSMRKNTKKQQQLLNTDFTSPGKHVDVVETKNLLSVEAEKYRDKRHVKENKDKEVSTPDPIVIPIPSNTQQTSITHDNTVEGNKRKIDSKLDYLIDNVFNSTTSLFEQSVKKHVFESSVDF